MMEDITLNLDAQYADVLRRRVASACGTAGETLHRAADGYAYIDEDISAFRAVMTEVEVWSRVMDSLGWDPDQDAAGESRAVTAPRERLRELLTRGLVEKVEALDEVRAVAERSDQRPSEVIGRKVEEIKLFEELLDRVGWLDPEDGGGR